MPTPIGSHVSMGPAECNCNSLPGFFSQQRELSTSRRSPQPSVMGRNWMIDYSLLLPMWPNSALDPRGPRQVPASAAHSKLLTDVALASFASFSHPLSYQYFLESLLKNLLEFKLLAQGLFLGKLPNPGNQQPVLGKRR